MNGELKQNNLRKEELKMETLVLPNHYVAVQEDEMVYLDGGWAVPTWTVKYGLTGIATAALTAVGGWGLKAVLASYGMRTAFVSAIVKGLGAFGIHVGNAFANNIVKALTLGGISEFAGGIANDLDRNDGNLDGWINW